MKFDLEINTNISQSLEITEYDSNEIAIIGIAVRTSVADDPNVFWDAIIHGIDCTNEVSDIRKENINKLLEYIGLSEEELIYQKGSFLSDIECFDNKFFNISSKESELMDPNQRIFLETVWKAIEDSGYGGDILKGSRTGVYVGDTDDTRYKELITKISSDTETISTAGNINAVIASRISYIMNFKGPSMLIDTTCSSSLVAVHLACEALKNKTCDLAIAGGIKITFLPLEGKAKLGIESSSGKTKAFDDSSDGTVFGEGSIVLILKPLGKSIKDRDKIYAIIKGSAINQDGSSVGLTAPNVLSQEDVIIKAWENAKIQPDTIEYIEAHGTGTILGDPIEVQAISNAFRRFTEKKQFCAIGSVKSNIGHLGNAAGIAGLLKAIFAVKTGYIPPTLNFENPNSKISFHDSPVYVSDRGRMWKSDLRRCGVSSFGLSGTNCHMVIENAPIENRIKPVFHGQQYVFTLSAKSSGSMIRMIIKFLDFLSGNHQLDIKNLCYTLSCRRGHYSRRIAIVVTSLLDLIYKLSVLRYIGVENYIDHGIYYGKFKEVPLSKKEKDEFDISIEDKEHIDKEAHYALDKLLEKCDNRDFHDLLRLYVNGADIKWDLLYKDIGVNTIHIPTYEFEKDYKWIKIDKKESINRNKIHPLIDKCLAESVEQDIYETQINIDKYWIVEEHSILGEYFPPGTSYLEMIYSIAKRYYPNRLIEMQNILFITPLIINKNEIKKLQIIIKKKEDFLEFIIASNSQDQWIIHAEGKIINNEYTDTEKININKILQKCKSSMYEQNKLSYKSNEDINSIQVGERWSKTLCEYNIGDNEVLVKLKLADRYISDLKEYQLHPALFDLAVNAITQHSGNGLYLPMSYGKLVIYNDLPYEIYSHIKIIDKFSQNKEIMKFDIDLLDTNGKILCEIKDYIVKKVHSERITVNNLKNKLYKISWIENNDIGASNIDAKENILILYYRHDRISDCLINEIGLYNNKNIIRAEIDNVFQKTNDQYYKINNELDDYLKLFEDIPILLDKIIFISTSNPKNINDGVYSLFYITKALTKNRIKNKIDLISLTKYAFDVDGKEALINSCNTAIAGFGRVLQQEYANIKNRVIDIDDFTKIDKIVSEIYSETNVYQVAYRNGNKYSEQLSISTIKPAKPLIIHSEGVYIITGGTGSLGIETARYLASNSKTNIVLLSRTKIPDSIDHDTNPDYIAKVNNINNLKNMGSIVEVINVDVSNKKCLNKTLIYLRGKYGKINGIIHAAGVAGDGLIFLKSKSEIDEVLAPKTIGTYNLYELTKNDELEFFILFSSIATIIGAAGQGAYIAANAFLDSFVSLMRRSGVPATSINWAAWKNMGMAAKAGIKEDGYFKMMKRDTAINILDKVLHSDVKRIIAGELNYGHENILQPNQFLSLSQEIISSIDRGNKRGKNIYEQKVEKVSNNDMKAIEDIMIDLWKSVLGEDELDIYEDFYDLGGDSIIATQLLKRINEQFSGIIDITDIFTYTSISSLSEYIYKRINGDGVNNEKEVQADDLDNLLSQIETGAISIDNGLEVIKNINKMGE